jgi:S1-C subfamily serine protease
MRHWAMIGGAALIAAFISASAVVLIARADSGPSRQANGSGRVSAPNVAALAPGGAWMGIEMHREGMGEVVIDAVVPGSPAEVAGLRRGDAILAIDNAPVTSAADVTAALSALSPGRVIPVGAARGAAGFTAQVTLGARPKGHAVP